MKMVILNVKGMEIGIMIGLILLMVGGRFFIICGNEFCKVFCV